MTLPIEPALAIVASIGRESDGAASAPQGVVALATRVEFMQFCPVCLRDQAFVAAWDCIFGLVGCCAHCGDTRIAPFTRTNSEAA